MKTELWVIRDWANNELSKHGTFKSFQDGWSYIYEHFEEEDFEDLFVELA